MADNKESSALEFLLLIGQFLLSIAIFAAMVYLPFYLLGGNETRKAQPYKTAPTVNTSQVSDYESTDTSTGDYEASHGSDECTEDCSGHEAGYEWGEENEVCDTDYDEGNSDSFNEGVVAWAEDNC